MATVELHKVSKSFGPVTIIHGIDLKIEHGEFCVFVGPSGCGKSTLLRMIAGLEDLTSGDLMIDGQSMVNVQPADRGIAMVFQSYALYPHMTVAQNMGFGLRMTGTPKAEIEARVARASEILQLGPLLQRKPSQLSGGQRQRVAIGRSIVRNPKVFLFDEPLSNLDAELRVAMRVEIAKLHHSLGNTTIYVTHDQTEAMTLADKIVVLRAGKIEQYGAPLDLYNDPVNAFVAGFIGSPKMNFVQATVAEGGKMLALAGDIRLPAPLTRDGLKAGASVKLGIRPEHFDRDANPDVRLPIAVEVVEHLGGTAFVYGRGPTGEPIIAERRDAVPARPGDTMNLGFHLADARLFADTGARLR